MIIHAVYAENLLKYKKLVLEDLPEKGLISISGQNEAGKSTTGEVICFALFGRTFSLSSEKISKALRWGESRCQVSLIFSVGDGKRYQVTRYLDEDANQGVKVNEEGHDDTPLARGVAACDELLSHLVGFRYEEFIESFYLAQREITTPHPHSHAVKTMAGIASLEEVDGSIKGALPTEAEGLQAAAGRCDELNEQLQALALDDALLPQLKQQQETLQQSQKEQQSAMLKLEEDVKGYAFMAPDLSEKRRLNTARRSRSHFFLSVSLLLMLVFAAGWLLLTQQSDGVEARQLTEFLSDNIANWQPENAIFGLYLAAGSLLLLLLSFTRGRTAAQRLWAVAEEQRQVSAKLQSSFQALHDLQEWVDDGAASVVMESLVQALRQPESSLASVQELSATLLVAAEENMALIERQLTESATAIELEEKRCQQAHELNGMLQAFEEKRAECDERIRVRETALDLLAGACRHIAVRFNRDVRAMAGESLPSLTDGRYQHLEVDADLNVRVFSNEKRDFMVLDEVSSGTQRQIMLALRLALSQELVNTAIEGGQFLFLDEPFAFFDEERMRSSLEVLPKISNELSQIFVISQEFPADVKFDMNIRCSRSFEELTATLE